MKTFNYKQAGKDIGWNFAKINPKVEYLSNYNYYTEVVKHIKPTAVMLDIGCGSAEKAIRYYSLAKKVYETDLESEMLNKARNNAKKYYENNNKMYNKFVFKQMDCKVDYPFPDNHFDLVVSRHCGANIKEVYRILKKGGVFISEDISFNDCQELKEVFNRGQNYLAQPLYSQTIAECVDAGFSEVDFVRFEEIEYYKDIDELKYLLSYTPILNGYDETQDDPTLQNYVKQYTTNKGIKLNRRLYAFKLVK